LERPPRAHLPTGNDLVSFPFLSAADGSAPSLAFLSRKFRGLVELEGLPKAPFLECRTKVSGRPASRGRDRSFRAAKIESWLPQFQWGDPEGLEFSYRVFAPPYERGFLAEISVRNHGKKRQTVHLGLKGCWGRSSLHGLGRSVLKLDLEGTKATGDFTGLVLAASSSGPEFALALAPDEGGLLELQQDPLRWSAGKQVQVEPGSVGRFCLLAGIGLDPASAKAACLELRRLGPERLWNRCMRFLVGRQRRTGDPGLDAILNENLLFSYFFTAGTPLEEDRLSCLVSRSPFFPAGAVYSDRAALLWSFPPLLLLDNRRARQVLEHAFSVQSRQSTALSRGMDGSLCQPGFALDQLAAPVIALAAFTRSTGDPSLAGDFQVRRELKQIERVLQQKKHPSLPLYETSHSPSGAAEDLPYLTYGNVLAFRLLTDLAELKERSGREQEARPLREQAERLRRAIWQHLTSEGPGGRMFVWSSDLKSQKRFGTDPAGCLQLLPYWGFCRPEDEVWRNTVAWLHSRGFAYSFSGEDFEEIGGPSETAPSVLGLANSLLSGRREEARAVLQGLPMESRLACQHFSPKDGHPTAGLGFASGAGFLAWAIWKAFGKVR
jgi:hypothetical protein